MNRGQFYTARRHFIEHDLNSVMSCIGDFEGIKYVHSNDTDEEFVKLTDTIGGKAYFDITAVSNAGVLLDISRLILSGKEKVNPPRSMVTDDNRLRYIAELFRKGGRACI